MEESKYGSANYPTLLAEIAQPPNILYYRGKLPRPSETCLAVVGTRRATNYGKAVVDLMVPELCAAGITIISGLAYGIDAFAHQAALAAGGKTIAVLPGGIDDASIYPRGHMRLAHEISETGCLLSECSPVTPIQKYTFLARNRIIAGLSVGTLVIECAERSGALITARHAREENRAVYAVPGSLFSEMSRGPHALLQEGAIPVTSAKDILRDLNILIEIKKPNELPIIDLTENEKLVLQYISNTVADTDTIVSNLSLSMMAIITALSSLELKNIIAQNSAGKFLRIKN